MDAVSWIEAIPFTETRNYVMRVLEGLHVYRARLQGEAAPVQIVSDINADRLRRACRLIPSPSDVGRDGPAFTSRICPSTNPRAPALSYGFSVPRVSMRGPLPVIASPATAEDGPSPALGIEARGQSGRLRLIADLNGYPSPGLA